MPSDGVYWGYGVCQAFDARCTVVDPVCNVSGNCDILASAMESQEVSIVESQSQLSLRPCTPVSCPSVELATPPAPLRLGSFSIPSSPMWHSSEKELDQMERELL
jgi:hypothetical protein